jgi:hypothetical protein
MTLPAWGSSASEQRQGSLRMASENWQEITGEFNGKSIRGRFKTDSKGIVTVSSPMAPGQNVSAGYLSNIWQSDCYTNWQLKQKKIFADNRR